MARRKRRMDGWSKKPWRGEKSASKNDAGQTESHDRDTNVLGVYGEASPAGSLSSPRPPRATATASALFDTLSNKNRTVHL